MVDDEESEDQDDLSPLEDVGFGVFFFLFGAFAVCSGFYQLFRGSFGVLLGASFFAGPIFMLVGFGAFWRFVFGHDFSFGLDDEELEDHEEEEPEDDEDESHWLKALDSRHLLFLLLGAIILVILSPLMILLFLGGVARLFGLPLPESVFGPPGAGRKENPAATSRTDD